MCNCFGATGMVAALRLVPVGHWSDVLHAFAVSQFLKVRFEVVSVALLGVVGRASIGEVQDM